MEEILNSAPHGRPQSVEEKGQAPYGHSYARAFACRFGASPLFSTDHKDPLLGKYTPLPERTQMSLVSSIAVDYLEEVAVQDR